MGNLITASRTHEFCMGHTVTGHESKCRHYHGHNYVITFHCQAFALDEVGRVIDFSVIKSTLCQWIEDNWDHKFMMYDQDDRLELFSASDDTGSLIETSFNPTAENIAKYFLDEIAPTLLPDEVTLIRIDLKETGKCGVTYEI